MRLFANISTLLRSDKSWVAADQLLVSGSAFVTTLLVARSLNPEGFGLFATVNLIQLFLLAMQNSIVTAPFQVEQAKYTLHRLPKYMQTVAAFQLIIILLLFSLAAFVFFLIPRIITSFHSIWWGSTLLIGGFLMQDTIRRLFLATKAPQKAFWLDLISNIPQLGLLLLYSFRNHLQLESALWIMGITYLPSLLLGLYWLKGFSFNSRSFWLTFRVHFHQGRWLLLTSLVQWWAGNYFIVAAGVILGAAAFGALRLAQYILGLLNVLLQAVENYILPEAARIYEHDPSAFPLFIRNQLNRSLLLMLPILLVMIAFPSELMTLAGGKGYDSFSYLLPSFSLLYVFIFTGYPVRIVIRVMKLNREFFIGYLISAAFGVLAARTFILQWGASGVVAGLIVNQLLLLGYWLWILQRKKYFVWK